MLCSTCGGHEFEYQTGDGPIRCTGCDRVFTRDELVRENGARIEAEVQELGGEAVEEIRKEIKKAFKKLG